MSLKNKVSKNKNFILLIICLFSIRWSFADHYRVPTGSMLPTIQIGDHVLVNKAAYHVKLPFSNIVLTKVSEPQRGEIIVFEYPLDPKVNFVKRLIAVPGDRVEIHNGFVKVNGKMTLSDSQSYKDKLEKLQFSSSLFNYSEILGKRKFIVQRNPKSLRAQSISFIVPQDQYFFMGDNRDSSVDSRYWGFVPRKNLKGRVHRVSMSVYFEGLTPQINFKRFGKELI